MGASVGRQLQCLWVVAAVTVGACATAPKTIRTPVAGPPVLAAVQNIDRYVGERVRWGGTIVEVENQRTETWLQVVARRLRRDGRPIDSSTTTGRFMAVVPGFLEPEEYQRGRDTTVVGTLTKGVTRNIGEYPYKFPVVQVDDLYLWEPLPEFDPYFHAPYFWGPFYDPWYDPWWPHAPFYRYPRYRHPHHHR